jgi:hypothetical protein
VHAAGVRIFGSALYELNWLITIYHMVQLEYCLQYIFCDVLVLVHCYMLNHTIFFTQKLANLDHGDCIRSVLVIDITETGKVKILVLYW